MDSRDNIHERFAALEQQMEQWKQQTQALEAHTRTVARGLRWWRGLACGVLVLGLLSGALPSGQTVDAHRRDLSARVADLEDKLQFVTISEDEMVITRANLRIVNGLGKTDCGFGEEAIPDCPNGLGNLIVGYNEERPPDIFEGSTVINTRTGSHNIVVGTQHNFSRFGGIVVGVKNEISGQYSSVSGGSFNTASGAVSSVSGGSRNTASGRDSAVSGGRSNAASGEYSAVSGGGGNWASGRDSAVSGGSSNVASGNDASVSGGEQNTASGQDSAVSGGFSNTASGQYSSVSGGRDRQAPEDNNWAAGSLLEDF